MKTMWKVLKPNAPKEAHKIVTNIFRTMHRPYDKIYGKGKRKLTKIEPEFR